MYKEFTKFYYNLGIRKYNEFVNPKTITLEDIGLPNYVVVHYPNDNDIYPTKAMGIYNNIRDGYIVNVLQYIGLNTEARKRNVLESSLVSKLNKEYNSIKTLTSLRTNVMFKKKPNKLKDILLTYNYGLLNDTYIYKETKDKDLIMFRDKYNTIVNNILLVDSEYVLKKHTLNQFLYITVPDTIYSVNLIKKHLNTFNLTEFKKAFYNNENLVIFEIYKLLYSSTTKDSVFYKLLPIIDKVSLVITYKNKSTIINLKTLLSFSKEYSIDLGNTKVDDNTILHMFFNILHTLILSNEEEIPVLDVEEDLELSKSLLDNSDDDITIDNEDDIEDKVSTEEITKITDVEAVDEIDSNNRYDDVKEEDILNEVSVMDTTKNILEDLVVNNDIDKKKLVKLKKHMDDFLDKPTAFDKNVKVKDMLVYKDDDFKIDDTVIKGDFKSVRDTSELGNTTKIIDETNMKKLYKKDMLSTFYNMQKSGLIIKDMDIEHTEDILGGYDTYKLSVSDKGKSSYSINLRIPTISENGTYKISGSTYRLRRQRVDIPIKRVNNTKVTLTTAYGKLNLLKAPMKKYDAGYRVRRDLVKLQDDGIIDNLLFGTFDFMNTKLPQDYYLFSRYIKSFTFKNYIFDFNHITNKDILPEKDISKYTYVGKLKNDNKTLLVMGNDNIIHTYKNGNVTPIDTLSNILDISIPIEFTFIKIFNTLLPITLLLTYYLGFKNLLKLLKVKYEVLDGIKRIKDDKAIVVYIKNSTIVIYPEKEADRILLSGFNDKPKIMKTVTFDVLNNKQLFMTIFKQYGFNLTTITEVKVLENLFIDSNTKTILELLKLPTTFIGMILNGNSRLVTDSFNNPRDIKNSIIKGYERIPQAVHKVLVDAVRKKTGEEYFGKSKLVVDPYAVWRILNEDSAAELVDDLNPISYLKQKEDLTVLGFGGVGSKETMVAKTRAYDASDLGVVSEAIKDKTDVGITAYLSANPVLNNMRGLVQDKNDKELSWSNIMSTTALISPFGLADDPKRLVYSGIQASHVIPVDNPRVFPVRTSYMSILPYKLDENFIGISKDDGKVTKVSSNSLTIVYKKLGKVVVKFHNWTSKEESNTTYTHILKPNFKEGDKVRVGDILYYDTGFFEPDMFDRTKVVYRTGTYARTAMIESEDTREDSFVMSKGLSNNTKTKVVKIRDMVLKITDNITNLVEVGTVTNYDTPLYTKVSTLASNDFTSKETLDLLQGFVNVSPKADYIGKLIKIQVYYNADMKDISKSLKKLIEISEPFMVDKVTNKKYSGLVNSSYSVMSKPLLNGEVHIKFYVETEDVGGTGDKYIFANQLKATVTNVSKESMLDEHGNEIDAKFSYTSLAARIVESSNLLGTTATALQTLTDNVVKKFFK